MHTEAEEAVEEKRDHQVRMTTHQPAGGVLREVICKEIAPTYHLAGTATRKDIYRETAQKNRCLYDGID